MSEAPQDTGNNEAGVAETCKKVEDYLRDFGETFSKVDTGRYFAKKGSTLVGIHVSSWRNDALVHVSSNVVKNANLNDQLLKALLEWNFRSSFGSFGVSPEGTITLRYTLLGSTLEKQQLIPAVLAVANASDDWDDKIIAMAGGETAVETLKKQVGQG